jgi:hypothetical protein
LGCRTDTTNIARWQQFEDLLSKIQFSQLPEKYTSSASDMPGYQLCRQRPRKCLLVEEYPDLPENLKHLDETIGLIFGLDRWMDGTVEAVKRLKAEHYNFNLRAHRTSVEEESAYGGQTTMLIRAVEYSKSASVVAGLLKAGADIHRRDGAGFSPLMRAIDLVPDGYAKTAVLLHAGANVCDRGPDGDTSLSLVRKRRSGLPDDPEVTEDKAELGKIERLLIDSGDHCGEK